ncbi:MAG: hypothetical protein J6W70_09355 [Lentisphaeria bacterium]|nr:hypothetical protein [Lentisphaeria bacterium]
MKRIAIVICWFGPLPVVFPLWCKSCAANPTVDWLLFTDQEPSVPDNVHVHRMSFAEIGELARRKLDFPELSLEKPYKLCDYKVMYGVIFDDWLKEYDFWGYCDLDMVFGDLRGFFSDEMLDRYDKLLSCGHLSLYRNTPEVNSRFRLPGSKYTAEEVMRSRGITRSTSGAASSGSTGITVSPCTRKCLMRTFPGRTNVSPSHGAVRPNTTPRLRITIIRSFITRTAKYTGPTSERRARYAATSSSTSIS